MAIYMKIPSIRGDVSTKGYEHAIELLSLDFQVHRQINTGTGLVANRVGSLPSLREVHLTKLTDRSSVSLFEHSCGTSKVIPKLEIHYCHTGTNIIPYAQYNFHDVILTNYHELFDAISEHPIEHIAVSYTKVEKKFIPRDKANQRQAPMIAGYDKETATLI